MRISLLMLSVSLFVFTAHAADTPAACTTAEYRQFDFWIGDWDVTLPNGKKAGTNHIERISKGCALLENWSGTGDVLGKSLNIYDAADKQWHQFWVDSGGSRLTLEGVFVDSKMIMKSETIDKQLASGVLTQRITWTPQADGSVRQLWESSEDRGKTWTVAFDGKYVRKK